MHNEFKNQTVIVTGATGGLGRPTAALFSQNSANVVICYHANENEALKMQREFKERDEADPLICCLDITDPGSCKACIEKTIDKYSHIDILINLAGISGLPQLLEDIEHDLMKNIINTNLLGTAYMTQAVIPLMKKQKKGNVVNVGSIAGQNGSAGAAIYAASKSGLIALTKSLAKECAPFGIRVNMLTPGYLEVGMMRVVSERTKRSLYREIPMKRWGEIDEIIECLLFLCSDKCSYVTGHDFSVNGGAFMR